MPMIKSRTIDGCLTYDYVKQLTWDFIIENEIVSEKELQMATDVGGYNMETLNYVIYSRTGYHDIPQLYECEPDGYYFPDEIVTHLEDFED